MSLVAAFTCSPSADAATLHKDISITTYADFGQNMGRYAVGNTSALQKHLTSTQGVQIVYTGGQAPITLPHGMIDFSSASSAGNTALLGYNYMATVQHVNWGISTNYSGRYIGSDHAIKYNEVVCWGSPKFNNNMVLDGTTTADTDYRVSRINKLITDVDGSTLFYGNESSLKGQYIYRVGAGYTYKQQEDGTSSYIGMPITGGMDTIDAVLGSNRYRLYVYYYDSSSAGVNAAAPAPYNSSPGDSGSPCWVWNTETERYEYAGALEGATGNVANCYRGADVWTKSIMEKYDVSTSVAGGSTIYLSAVNTAGDTIADAQNSTTLYSGAVTDASGNELARYNGVREGLHAWNDLSGLKDTQQWYAYDNSYMNTAAVSTADLFYNSNLVISADSAEKVSVVLDDTVDLGIGYVQFKPATAGETAEFEISSAAGESNLLNTAGFVVEKGASVHMKLTNPSDYMREWRKVGEGDLYIEGSGNNDIFLNVGGAGTTYLARTNGYAAYNVLVNNGSTVVINDINQIRRDLTFGNRGGVLDVNGNSLYWNNDADASASGFTIHALDEQAIITNSAAGVKGTPTLTWSQAGEQTWLGSFVDSEAGALKFVYDGNPLGESPNSRLVMHSIHTDLSNNANSGIEVWSGTLALQGRNTVHAENSLTGNGGTRYFHEDDWHYADAKANVTIDWGGTFELGSHARLEGEVTVTNGTFIMREGVKHQMEYIEGGYVKENTDTIRDYFGLKGNVKLASGTQMLVQFSEGTDSTLVYDGSISGSGSLTVEAGTNGAALYLTGDNSGHTGSKTLVSGGLYDTSGLGLGDTSAHKWLIQRDGWLASESMNSRASIEAAVDIASTGTLALTHDLADDLTAAGYSLIIGAAEGKEVHYGTANQALTAVNGVWTLGGGGGNLVVDFLLTGANQLVLGTENSKGHVHLTNTGNYFTGGVQLTGGVTLSAVEGALSGSQIALSYTNRMVSEAYMPVSLLRSDSEGVLLLDKTPEQAVDLTQHTSLALGAKDDCRYTGQISLAENAVYRFGSTAGTFTVASKLEAGHDVIIDGQTYEGGTVVLANAADVDGHVTIMGWDSDRTGSATGTATLGFEANNELTNAASFTVKDGGSIDLMGTEQQLNNVHLMAGSSITDSSSAGSSGKLTLNNKATLEGTLNVDLVAKTGSGELSLGGTNHASRFEIQGGTATLASATATHAAGTLAVTNATLDLNGQAVQGTLELGDGASVTNVTAINNQLLGVGTGTASVASGTQKVVIKKLAVEQGGHLTLNALASATNVDNTSVAEGGQLTFNAQSGFNSTNLGAISGAGDILLNIQNTGASSQLPVSFNGNNSNFTGHLTIEADGSGRGANFASVDSVGRGVVTLNGASFTLNRGNTMNNASTAIAATLDIGEKGTTLYSRVYFTNLSGAGTLNVATNSYSGQNNLQFIGDVRGFSGSINVAADGHTVTFGGEGVSYHTATGTAGDTPIKLFASTGTPASLKGSVVTNIYKFQYTDDVILNARVTNAQVQHLGSGTLIIGEDNSSTYDLNVTGGGSIQFGDGGTSGSWAGRLYITNCSGLINKNLASGGVTISSIYGNIGSLSLMQGSKLTLNNGGSGYNYSLNAGCSLDVFGGTPGESAALSLGSLTMNGGELAFSGNALHGSDTASLAFSGNVNASSTLSGQTINLYDAALLSEGTYLLASGNWSALSDKSFTVAGVDSFYTSSVTANSDGLRLTLSLDNGVEIWKGTDDAHEWSLARFGSTTSLPWVNAVFSDVAANHTVDITGTVSVDKLTFDSTADDYVLAASGAARLTAGGAEVRQGTASLGGGISVTGASSIAEGAKLVVNHFSTLAGAVSGAGTLVVDAGSASGCLTGDLAGLATLQLVSGRYEAGASAIGASTVEVKGGQYAVSSGTHGNNFVLGGNGWSGTGDHSSAALSIEGGATLSGSISLNSDATVAVTGAAATLSGSIDTGDHTLVKTGESRLTLSSNSISGNIDVHEGSLFLTGQPTSGIKTLTLRENTTMQLDASHGKFAADSLVMENGSRINLRNGNSGGGYFSANIALTGTATLAGAIYGNATNVQGTIKGDGTLQLERHGGTNTWRISSAISDAEGGKLTVVANSYVQIYGDNSYTGGTTVNGSTLTTGHVNALGGGALTVNGGLVQQQANLLLSTLDGASAAHVFTNGKVLTLGNGTTVDDVASFAGTLDGNGTVVKLGEGRQELSGTVSQSLLSAAGGVLALNGATVTGAIEVGQGGSLALAGNLTLSQTIASEGVVTLGEGLHFNLSETFGGYDASSNSYTIISGGTINYAESGFSFTVNGISSTDLEADNYELSQSSNGLTITMGEIMQDVTWNGSGSRDVWSTSAMQDNWQQGGVSSSFSSLDNVTFGSEGSRSVEVDAAGVKVNTMAVTGAGYSFTGGAIHSVGDVSIASGASADFKAAVSVGGTLTVAAGASASFASGAELGALSLTSSSGDTTLEFAGDTTIGADGTTRRKLGSAADAWWNNVSINVGEGATVQDNGYWSMVGGSLTIGGKGVYMVEGICLSDGGTSSGWYGPQSRLEILKDATMVITGNKTSNAQPSDANQPSFNLGHWRSRAEGASSNSYNIITLAGTLISHAGFSLRDGSAVIDVENTGTLALIPGLSLTRNGGSVTVNVEGTLALGTTTQSSVNSLTVNLKNGSTLAAWIGDEGTDSGDVTVNYGFTISAGSSLNVKAGAGQNLTVGSNLQNASSLSASGGGNITLTNTSGSLSSVSLGTGTRLSLGSKASVSLGQASLAQGSAFTVADGAVTVGATAAPMARSRSAAVEGVLENVTLSGTSMTSAEATSGVVRNAEIAISASAYSMSGIELVASAVTLDATELNLQDVVLGGGSTVAATGEAASTVQLENVTFVLDDSMSYEHQDAATLLGAGYTGTVRVYDISNFSNVTLAGGMLMDVSALQPQTASALGDTSGYDYLAFNFSGSTVENDFLLSTNAAVEEGMKLGTSTYVFRAESSGAVPEPATSALALLGLGALALRRRRK